MSANKKNIILVDFDVTEKWDYLLAIEKVTNTKWHIKKCITNKLHGNRIKTIIRYFYYFVFSLKIFLYRNQYEKIIAWQQFFGLILAFYCRLFRVSFCPQIFVMTFIYKPKKNRLYNWFIMYVTQSKYITKLIVLSDSEVDYYSELFGVDKNRFYSTRIGVSDISGQVTASFSTGKYYLAVGRSNRDYHFLREVWRKEYGELIVVNDSYTEDEKEGITVLRDCYGEDYINRVANCYAQIIPLDDPNIASGSLSFLQAMMLSKPTIVTENYTVYDYIVNKHNGMIIDKTEQALKEAIEFLDNREKYEHICKNARLDYEKLFSEYRLGEDIGKLIAHL